MVRHEAAEALGSIAGIGYSLFCWIAFAFFVKLDVLLSSLQKM